jgi:hypothetical protein
MKLIASLLFVAACGKSEPNKSAPKPVEEPVVEVKKAAPKPAPKEAIPTATPSDLEYAAKLDDWMKFTFKPAQDTFIEMEVKPTTKNGLQAFDVFADGKRIDTIDSGIQKGEHGMEVTARISAMKEGVMAYVHATKTTGKPADYDQGRVYEWKDGTMQLKRRFAHEQVYDPSMDGM